MWIAWIAILGAVIYLIAKLAQGSGSQNGGLNRSAEEVLKERYARGEISKGEYEEKLREGRR